MNEITELRLRVGESVSRELPNLAMSGFQWSLDGGDEIVEARIVVSPPSAAEGRPMGGSVGESRLEVRGVAVGTAELTLRQKRPWETTAYEERILHVAVT